MTSIAKRAVDLAKTLRSEASDKKQSALQFECAMTKIVKDDFSWGDTCSRCLCPSQAYCIENYVGVVS